MLKAEWRSIWKDKKLTLSIVVMFIMPILYCGMLLWAFWDPYGHLDQLPVAIVNDDKGAEIEGEQIALGDELLDNLLDSKTFKFIEVAGEEAEHRLLNEEYYILIKIPENFSEHATTLLDEQPEKLELEYMANEAYNFLGSRIGDSAIKNIRDEVNEEIVKTYAEQLFDVVAKMGEGYTEASDGALKINDGAVELANGTQDLKGYLQQLAESTITLSDSTGVLYDGVISAANGATQLVNGSTTLANGSKELAIGAASLNEGATNLQQGITSYVEGVAKLEAGQAEMTENQNQMTASMTDLASGTSELYGGVSQLSQGANSLQQGITSINAQLQQVLAQLPPEQKQALQQSLAQLEQSSEQLATGLQNVTTSTGEIQQSANKLAESTTAMANGQQQLLAGANELSANATGLVNGAANLQQGSNTIANKLAELSTGATTLASGTAELSSGLSEVVSGTAKINDGTTTLSSKSGELVQGSEKLAEGTTELIDGTSELSTSLAEVSEEADISMSDANYEMFASPVEVDKDIKFEVDNYGTGLAPYFISLGLFVGALLLTNVYPFVQPAVHPTGIWRWFISKSAVPFVVWIFQVGIIVAVLKLGLGLHTESLGLFILTAAITSFAFLAIVQMLTVIFGDVGRFISLVFLIVQLASSAGTFPVELIPDKLRALHEFMPMTYSVKAFRAVTASGDMSIITNCLMILSIIGIVCVMISLAFFALLYKRRYSKSIEA